LQMEARCNWIYSMVYMSFLAMHFTNSNRGYWRACFMYTVGYACFAVPPALAVDHMPVDDPMCCKIFGLFGSMGFTLGSVLLVRSCSIHEVCPLRGGLIFLVGSSVFLVGSMALLVLNVPHISSSCLNLGSCIFVPGRLCFFVSAMADKEEGSVYMAQNTSHASTTSHLLDGRTEFHHCQYASMAQSSCRSDSICKAKAAMQRATRRSSETVPSGLRGQPRARAPGASYGSCRSSNALAPYISKPRRSVCA
jgi:hypothetical protein